ncbi:MAG: KpsF/GutQ family sugar-phosphate isomerase [Neomegalonema sp.]|nr:KpsF/GutQ family sugar-phosphate isomerase [Neomegalonema sp.]
MPDTLTQTATSLESARKVLRTEGEALLAFADQLDARFEQAVETILKTEGRVVVSGMGKSGHIGKKIAATFASTGTPAQFVHPAEASHGDLGMLTQKDAALVLSNSGETPELHHLIEHTRRYEIPLIGVASRPESTLLKAADIALVLPDAPEACPMGLAPTTSTTTTLALGDALAVALMERRNFTPEHFRAFHPGGKLGAKLLRVEALMHGPEALPLVHEGAPMTEAILQMTNKSFGVAGVTDASGALIGVISDGDLRRNMAGLLEMNAGAVATSSPKTIHADALAGEAVALMNRYKITCLFVTAQKSPQAQIPVGLIHIHDCLRAGVV